MKRFLSIIFLLLIVPISVTAAWSMAHGWPENWQTADWSSAQLSPDPASEKQAVIQVYAARAGRWKGVFSVHTWIAFKAQNALRFTRFDVVGWGRPVRENAHPVDGRWYGNTPEIILEIKGKQAQALIPRIRETVKRYPYVDRGSYRVWPGPNSNTFIAWIGRQIPELRLEMPSNALGKDYIGEGVAISSTPSGSGWQFSLWGVFGMGVGAREGLEFHVLGTTIGLDFDDLGIKLPGVGTLGLNP